MWNGIISLTWYCSPDFMQWTGCYVTFRHKAINPSAPPASVGRKKKKKRAVVKWYPGTNAEDCHSRGQPSLQWKRNTATKSGWNIFNYRFLFKTYENTHVLFWAKTVPWDSNTSKGFQKEAQLPGNVIWAISSMRDTLSMQDLSYVHVCTCLYGNRKSHLHP